MTETAEVSSPILPEIIKRDPLEALQSQFQQEIGQGSQRLGLGAKIMDRLRTPRTLVPAAAAATAGIVFAPGFVEGLAKGLTIPEALIYTLASTPLSTIWEAAPDIPAIINGFAKSDLKPMLELIEKYGLATRATIVPAITSTTLIGGAFALWERTRGFKEAIKNGVAAITRKSPQFMALFGEDSFIGEAFYQAAPQSVIPIVETSGAARGILTGSEDKGVYINLAGQRYVFDEKDRLSPWGKLRFNKDWLLPTNDGRQVLLVIGFGETKDEELPLVAEEAVDLTVEEQALASKQILAQAKRLGLNPDQVVNIYIGNPERKRMRGTGAGLKEVSDREVAAGTIDIFLNAGGEIIKSVREKIGQDATLTFETGVPEYWQGFQNLAKEQGLTVHNETNLDPGNAVVLFYEKQTDETVQSAEDFKIRHPERRVMVLTSSLTSHKEAQKAGLESVCVAEILAGKLGKIIGQLKNGVNPAEIQNQIDSGLKK